MGDIGVPVGEPDGHAFRDDGPAGLQDVAAAHRVVALGALAVELAEINGSDDGGKVEGQLTRHSCGVHGCSRQQLRVEQGGPNELAVMVPEQCGSAEDFQQQGLSTDADHHTALAVERLRCGEAVPVEAAETVQVLGKGAGG